MTRINNSQQRQGYANIVNVFGRLTEEASVSLRKTYKKLPVGF